MKYETKGGSRLMYLCVILMQYELTLIHVYFHFGWVEQWYRGGFFIFWASNYVYFSYFWWAYAIFSPSQIGFHTFYVLPWISIIENNWIESNKVLYKLVWGRCHVHSVMYVTIKNLNKSILEHTSTKFWILHKKTKKIKTNIDPS